MSSSSSSSSSSTTTATFSLDHLSPSPSDQLCYVHCSFCDTDLAVSVPYTSMYKTVTVRCGFCSNLLSVNMRALHVSSSTQIHLGNSLLTTSSQHTHPNLLDENSCTPPPLMLDHHQHQQQHQQQQNQSNITTKESMASNKRTEESIQNYPAVNRPPEKRQRVPSAYNRFIKDEIQRIKAVNPDITHREAFSAAAKNWAHFPHIHFGLMHDHGLKKNNIRQQDDHGFYTAAAAAANMRLTPY